MKLKRNKTGQSVLEYVMLSTLIGIFCLIAVKQFGQVIQNRIHAMKKEVTKNLEM